MRKTAVVIIATLSLMLVTLATPNTEVVAESKKLVLLKGVVKQISWVSPHVTIVLEEWPTKAQWLIRCDPPSKLKKRGMTQDTFKIGTQLVLTGYQNAAGSKTIDGDKVTLPDGRSYYLIVGPNTPSAP